MIRLILIFILYVTIIPQSLAVYDVNTNCKNAWMLLMNLEIDKAKTLLAKEIEQNPENYYAYYLDQTCDAYKLIINSNEEDYEQFVDDFYEKREIMNEKDENSPYYLSCYSEMQIQLGMFNIINGDEFSGLHKMQSAYKKVYRNLDKHPDFKPSLKLDGFFNVAIANLPPFIKWVVSFFGVSTDVEYGFKVLDEIYTDQKDIPGINAESALFTILSAKINKSPERVYEFTKSLDSSVSETFIHTYFRANVAYRIGKNEEALSTLNQIDHNKNEYTEILYSYLMGKILLRKLDPQAGYHIKRYLGYLEKKEYLKEMNYNLALYYLINGEPDKYWGYCEIVKKQGMDMQERDREALYDAKLDYPPDVNLVKARLSLDGGYIDTFLMTITNYQVNGDDITGHVLEYNLLMGRYQALSKNIDEAKKLFTKVIELGEDEDYYFASEAALRLGYIYKDQKMYDKANAYFKKSIKLYKNDYYEYIEDRARKAIIPK